VERLIIFAKVHKIIESHNKPDPFLHKKEQADRKKEQAKYKLRGKR
jgi:hypothetical protein